MTTATKERKAKARTGGIEIDYEVFKRAVKIASSAVATRAVNPALLSVRVGNGLVTGCTAGEYKIDVEVDELTCEPILLPADRLLKILHNATPGAVRISTAGESCVITIGRGEWTLPTHDAAEFPGWEPAGLHSMPGLPCDQFKKAVRHVIHAVDRDSSRYALGGVLIEAVGDRVSFVATDGRRLNAATCGHDMATDDFVREPKATQKQAPVVPSKPLSQLVAQCNGDARVFMSAGGGVFVGSVGGVTVTASTIQGKYPDWEAVFPEELPPSNEVLRRDLAAAVNAAAVVTTEASRKVRFLFRTSGLTLKAKSAEAGQAEIGCDVAQFSVDADVSLNPLYISSFLKPFGEDEEPCVSVRVCPADGKTVLSVGEDYRAVVMPLSDE